MVCDRARVSMCCVYRWTKSHDDNQDQESNVQENTLRYVENDVDGESRGQTTPRHTSDNNTGSVSTAMIPPSDEENVTETEETQILSHDDPPSSYSSPPSYSEAVEHKDPQ